MLTLTKKHCTIGVINNRIEKHGDEDVTAFDIPVELLLDPKELDALVGKHTHRALFNMVDGVQQPNFPRFDGFTLKDELEGAAVTLTFGATDHTEIEFEDARLKTIELSPQVGGETAMSCKLQVRPDPKDYVRLIESQNTELKISLADAKIAEKAKRNQRELPLTNGDGEPTPAGEIAATVASKLRGGTRSSRKKSTGGRRAAAH